jgi:hypothetical protein
VIIDQIVQATRTAVTEAKVWLRIHNPGSSPWWKHAYLLPERGVLTRSVTRSAFTTAASCSPSLRAQDLSQSIIALAAP